MKQFFRYIFIGTLALIPLIIVVQLVFWVNALSIDLFDFVSSYTNSSLYTTGIFAFILISLALIGSSIEQAGKSYVISIIDKILEKIPAIREIYSILKKVTALFAPSKKDEKKDVVLVEYPKEDAWVPAYVLNKYDGVLVLFVPTSPNPTSGYVIVVEEHKVKKTTLTLTQASQFIVSMGADFVKKEEIVRIIKEHNKNKEIS
jgi:uncharacterized membrane protein